VDRRELDDPVKQAVETCLMRDQDNLKAPGSGQLTQSAQSDFQASNIVFVEPSRGFIKTQKAKATCEP
jgi:hypothetical protein